MQEAQCRSQLTLVECGDSKESVKKKLNLTQVKDTPNQTKTDFPKIQIVDSYL